MSDETKRSTVDPGSLPRASMGIGSIPDMSRLHRALSIARKALEEAKAALDAADNTHDDEPLNLREHLDTALDAVRGGLAKMDRA